MESGLERLRVWWEPASEKGRDGYCGAFWPALNLGAGSSRDKRRVRYDNGDEEEVHIEHISPNDTLPVDFGEEETELMKGEFCEVHNGSKTDPCAWLGRVVRRVPKTRHYTVEYPFHDSKPEKIDMSKIRRARIMEDGEWRLIKPGQEWVDGEVTSPVELELINEDELEDYLPRANGASGSKKSHGEGRKGRGRPVVSDSEQGREVVVVEEEDEAMKKLIKGRPGDPRPLKQARHEGGAEGEGNRRLAPLGTSVHASPPSGMLSIYVTIEPRGAGDGYSFVPIPANQPQPIDAFQVLFPLSAVPQLTAAEIGSRAQQSHLAPAITNNAEGGPKQNHVKAPPVKKPKSAWTFFMERNKLAVAEEFPDKDGNEVIAILGARWRNVPPLERAIYEAEAEREMSSSKASESLPQAPRTAEQLYSVEFIKALQSTPGGPGQGVTDSVAKTSAHAAWLSADASIKEKYEANAVADKQRYEIELAAWQLRSQGDAAFANGGGARANPPPAVVDPDDWDEVLDRGIDLKKVKRRIQDLGFTNNAYLLLVDAWRRDSPKITEAMQCYKIHIHGCNRPNWTGFLTDLLGQNQIESLKRKKEIGNL